MLDLNLQIVSTELSCDENCKILMNENGGEEEKKLLLLPPAKALTSTQLMEDSGSTNSSIINAEEVPSNASDENSSNNAFIFDIIKKDSTDIDDNPFPDSTTRQLFPVTGEKGRVELEFGVAGSFGNNYKSNNLSRAQWLNLCNYAEPSGEAELKTAQLKPQPKKSRRGPRSRSSQYRGVTFYRRTGRWESHIWDCGKQVYLGGFDTAHAAARAYDRAAIRFRGVDADINFTLTDYEEDMNHTKHMSKEEFVHILRRQSTGFSRGSSKYRGVTLLKHGRWEARMGQILGKKAYDIATMKFNGREGVTNFESSSYEGEIRNRGDICDDLDLSLGISTRLETGIKDAGDFHFHQATTARERPLLQSSASTLLKTEERVLEKRVEESIVVPTTTRFSNWAWQLQSNGNITPAPVFPIAASSGFSSSIATATTTLTTSTTTALNFNCLVTPATSSNDNNSHYYSYRR